jgi:hypothetical protein
LILQVGVGEPALQINLTLVEVGVPPARVRLADDEALLSFVEKAVVLLQLLTTAGIRGRRPP